MVTWALKALTIGVLLTACAFTTSYAQPHLDWVRRYSLNPAQTNETKTLALAKDGGLIVAGTSYAPLDQNDLDYYVVKYNPGGDTAWSLRFNSFDTLHDVVRAMTLDTNGDIYVTGTSDTIKLNSDGQLVWDINIPGNDIARFSSNAVYIVGSSEVDLSVSRLDAAAGTNVWSRSEDGGFDRPDTAEQVLVHPSGDVYVIGGATTICAGTRETCMQSIGIVRYSPLGVKLSFQTVGSLNPVSSAAESRLDGNGRIITLLNGTSLSYAWVWLNTDGSNQGDILPGGRFGTAMVVDSSGAAYITGRQSVDHPALHNERAATVKVDRTGMIVWQAGYPTSPEGRTVGTGISLDNAGNVFVCGQATNAVNGTDIFLVKYNSVGIQQWIEFYDGPAHKNDTATGIVIGEDGSIYVTGYSETDQGGTEFVTLKYSQPATASIERQPSGSIRINFLTAPNTPYILQATTNYFDWTNILTNSADPTGLVQFDDPTPTLPLRLYRGAKPQ